MAGKPSHGKGRLPEPLLSGLARVDGLIEAGQLDQGEELLVQLDRRYPGQPEVIGRIMNLALEAGDMAVYTAAAERLSKLLPGDPEIALAVAGGYLSTQRIALAQRAFAAVATRWPNHAHAAEARARAESLRQLLEQLWAEIGLQGPADLEVMAQHEELQALLSAGEWQRALRLGEQALRRQPGFVAIRNNLSIVYRNLGQTDRAIAAARAALASDPDNVHALANLTQFLLLAGKPDEAAHYAQQLRAIPTTSVDIAVKQAEALSFLGDDAGVLAAFEQVQRLKHRDDDRSSSALLHHLAAVASLRLGQSLAAHRRWQKALELNPGLELASANLADMERPQDERHAPWAYSIEYWLRREQVEELLRDVRRGGNRSEESLARDARRFLQRHPALGTLVPILLDRGDPGAREFALRLALLAQTPELLAALRDFALSQRGPTNLRLQAAQAAQHAGVLPNGTVRFWQGGAWQETIMFGFEVSGEASPSNLPQDVVELQHKAFAAMRAGDAATAERLLTRALERAPGDPSLLNNLGAAYGQLGRSAEARAIAERIHAEHPDYLFGCTNLVIYLVQDGKLDEAQALIDPLLQRRKLHTSELAAIMGAQVNIFLARGNSEAARSWLDMWEQVDPDHPHIPLFRSRLRPARRQKQRRR